MDFISIPEEVSKDCRFLGGPPGRLRKVRSSSVFRKMLQVCSEECNYLCSHLLFSSVRGSDSKKVNKLIKNVGSVVEPLEVMLHKIKAILDNPLHNTVIQQQECFQSEPSAGLLHHRPLQENLLQHPFKGLNVSHCNI